MSGNLHRLDPSVYLSWPTPNYVNPERRAWMPAYAGTLTAVASLAVVTRFWLRVRKQAGPLGLDDALLLPGWLAAIAFTVFTLLSTERYGSGTHTWDVPVPKFVPLAFNGWAAEVTYLASTGCTKCSILLFYRRLTKGSYNTLWKYAILTAIAFTALYSMAFILMLIFSCSPTEAYWKSFNPYYEDEFHCINSKYSNVLSGAMSVLSDLYSVLLPFVMLRNFDAPRRQKIALNIIFSLGLLVVAAGSVRTYYLEQVGHSSDLTWVGYDVYIWAQLETQLALICASAPTLRVFFRDYLSISVLRALSSARTGSRRDTRRASKRLPDDSTDSNRTGDSVPLTKIPTGKPNSLASLREVDDLEAASPPYDSTLQKEIATSRADAVYSDYSLDAGIPPAAYPPLREKQPFEDDPHGRYQLYPGKG